ncbi:PQQ-binding-like beta-propeller repeat protein [Cellulomonas sp.]|uniref:outer membrane protein assembly factor BamB family protein n=1 Tax=Cellulomonas sp. TaxID=40001 RepID=UPI003BABF6D1
MGRRGDVQEVELHDSAVPDDELPTDPRGSRGRVWLVGVVAVVALALGVTQWVMTARENAAVARLAQVPGVIGHVDESLDVVRVLTPQDTVALAGEAYGVLDRGADGAQSYQWFEPADDGQGWTTPLLDAPAGLETPSQVYFDSTCATDEASGAGTGDADHVVCLVTDGGRVVSSTGQSGDALPTTTTDIVVLDTADGSVLARWPLRDGYGVVALPGPVAVVDAQSDDGQVVTAYDPLSGRALWTHEARSTTRQMSEMFRLGDLVALTDAGGELTLLSSDGAVVRSGIAVPGDPSQGRGWNTDSRRGTVTLFAQASDGTSQSVVVSGADPTTDLEVDGMPLEVGVDDGSVPGLLLTTDSSVHAYDATTGAARWTTDVRSMTNALVVRGRVYVTTDREVVAIDGRSGRELWRSDELVGLALSNLLTDGEHILAPAERTGTTGVPALIAYDPASGAEVFRAPYPEGVIEVGALGRTLVGRDAASDEQVELG